MQSETNVITTTTDSDRLVAPNNNNSKRAKAKSTKRKESKEQRREKRKRREKKKKKRKGGGGGVCKRKEADMRQQKEGAKDSGETCGQSCSRMPASFEEMLIFNDQLMSQGSDYDAAMAAFITSDQSESGLWEEEADESLLLRDFLHDETTTTNPDPIDQTDSDALCASLGPREEEGVHQPPQRAKEGQPILLQEEDDESFTEIEIDEPDTAKIGEEENGCVQGNRGRDPPLRSPKRTRRRKRHFHEFCTGRERRQRRTEKWHRCTHGCESPSSDEGTTMVNCDDCRGWFHCLCQGTTPDELSQKPDLEFLCLKCLEGRVGSLRRSPCLSEADTPQE